MKSIFWPAISDNCIINSTKFVINIKISMIFDIIEFCVFCAVVHLFFCACRQIIHQTKAIKLDDIFFFFLYGHQTSQ